MNEGLKKRLVGATVLVSLVVIFVPMLLEQEPIIDQGITGSNIPPRPDTDFTSRVLPLENENLATPPAEVVAEGVGGGDIPTPAAPVSQPAATSPTPVKAESPPPPKPPKSAKVEERVGLSAWVIQVGSFSKRDNAERVVKQLKAKKFPAFIEQVGIGGKALFRVRVGPEIDRKLAEGLLKRVNKELVSLKLKGSLTRYQ